MDEMKCMDSDGENASERLGPENEEDFSEQVCSENSIYCSTSNAEEEPVIKVEPTEHYEEDTGSDGIVSSLEGGDDGLPLDVQISEPEVGNDSENETVDIDVEELPVKTEPIECKEEWLSEGDESNTYAQIKAEPLEEGFEDRINDFVKIFTKEKLPVQILSDDFSPTNGLEIEGGDENGHFLSQVKPKCKRKGGSLQCAECSAKFKYQSTYDYHVKSACGTKMIARDQLVKKSGKRETFECNVCQKKVCSRTSLMVHMRIHNGERPFTCDICTRSFYQKAHLKDHIKSHLDGKPGAPLFYTCAECGNVYSNKALLTSHMNVHFGDKIFDCNVCHKRFRTRSNLNNHKIIHLGKKPFGCSVCGKEFLRGKGLDDHMRIHTQEKPFECEICGKRFAEKNRRNTHVKRHTGELNQVCPTCGKKFASSYDLRVHQRMHTGEKPFSCNICGRMFNRKAIMEMHMTIHTGRKDFVCVECGEAFNRKSKLDVHLTTHTGEKFFCEICHRVFKCKAYLVPHVRTHFGEGKQRGKSCHCLLCGKKFAKNHKLQEHLSKAHPSVFKPSLPPTMPLNPSPTLPTPLKPAPSQPTSVRPPPNLPTLGSPTPPITFIKVEMDQ